MEIYEKIKLLVKEKPWTLRKLHREIVELFDDHAIAYLTLCRTVQGVTKIRESTLFQIASALKIPPDEIKKDTEYEEKVSRYGYNKKAYLEVEHNDLDFLTARLVLLPEAKTQMEQDPTDRGNFVKWLYGLQGKMTCIVVIGKEVEKHVIKKNESFSFNSTNPHYFENTSNKKAVCLLIQSPKYI